MTPLRRTGRPALSPPARFDDGSWSAPQCRRAPAL